MDWMKYFQVSDFFHSIGHFCVLFCIIIGLLFCVIFLIKLRKTIVRYKELLEQYQREREDER